MIVNTVFEDFIPLRSGTGQQELQKWRLQRSQEVPEELIGDL